MALIIYSDSTVAETQTVVLIPNQITISFERGTRIIMEDGVVPDELRVDLIKEDLPLPPPGMAIIGPVYELHFYKAGEAQPVTFSQPIRIMLNYDLMDLPPEVSALFIASYDPQLGWTQLQPITDLIASEGQVGALVNHFTLFTILAQPKPVEPVITTPVQSLLPARFQVSKMTLSTKQTSSGELITIRVNVKNTGELSGEHLLALKVNGLFIDGQIISLTPGQNRNFSFVISPYQPGIYTIEIDGISDTLTVLEGPTTNIGPSTLQYWPIPAVPILIGVSVFSAMLAVTYYLYRKRK